MESGVWKTEMDFQYMPIHLCTPHPAFFEIGLLIHTAQGCPALVSPFEYVSGIFRSFAREDAGNVSSGFWRWLVSVSSITGASFKLMHNRASQSTSSLIVTSLLPVQGGDWEPSSERRGGKKGRLTEKSRLHSSSLLIYTWGVMGLHRITGQQWMEGWSGLRGHLCQALTVRCVKLVIISSLKPCPIAVRPSCRLLGARRQIRPWNRMCLSGR